MMVSRTKMIGLVLVALIAGIGMTILGYTLWGGSGGGDAGGEHAGHDHAEEGGGEDGESDTYWTCPMHPSVVSETPGACPVCQMDLIKKTKTGGGLDPQELAAIGRVSLSPTQRVLANVQTTDVRTTDAESEIRAVGIVTYDETGLATIPSWVEGRIEKLLIKETGAVVDRGQAVMRVYSPELLAAQEEYLVARQSSSLDASLVEQARKRLELIGMTEAQIKRVERTGDAQETVTMTAPNAGTITEMKVRQGQYVKEGEPLYDIADLSTVWIEADVHEHNLPLVREGMQVRVTADAFKGESLDGEVTFIHPVVDEETRTVKVRVEVSNEDADAILKPGMYTTVFFQKDDDSSGEEELVVPRSAVIRGGKSAHVFIEVEENVFERKNVEIARATDNYMVIKSGIEAGQQVAAQGGFLLDSEVQLNSFGGSGGGHDHHEGHGEAEQVELTEEDIPEGGKEFDPPVPGESVPEGMWYCDMGTSHWIQHEKGDGECPVCGMFLKQKGADGGEEAQ